MNKRTFSYLIIGFILCTSLTAQTRQEAASTCTVQGDSTYVFHYPSCIRMFKANYKTNRQALQQLRRLLQTFEKGKDTLYVNGYSGECDTDSRNRRTAFHRSNNLKGYLINYYGLRERDFKTVNIPHNHPDLGDIVLVSLSLPVPTERTEETTATKEPPKTNEPAKPDVAEDTPPVAQPQPQQPKAEQPQAEQKQPQPQQAATEQAAAEQPQASPARYLGVKTNLAAWAGTILNLAADVQIGRHTSVELPVLWCPWHISDKHAVKTFVLQPEARYWLSAPGTGHFFGLHAHVGWFNVRWNRDRYQDTDRPLLGTGISYGYLLPLGEHWAGEFTLGAGYANMKYDTYYNIDNGARIDTRTRNYWGITRVGLSVVYRFNLNK